MPPALSSAASAFATARPSNAGRVGLEVDGAIGAHAHRLAQRLLNRVRTDREDDGLARALPSR